MRHHHPLAPYVFCAPAVAVFAFVVLIPTALTLYYSFFHWNALEPQNRGPAGMRNYEVAVLKDQRFLGAPGNEEAARVARAANRPPPVLSSSLANNLVYLFITLGAEVATGLALALLCFRDAPLARGFRSLMFVPVVLSLTVIALLWQFLLRADGGLVNVVLGGVGLGAVIPEQGWLGDPGWALVVISLISGWIYCGFYLVLFSAGLERIPRELIEAARIDGAGEWQRIRHIYLPLLREVGMVSVLLCVTGAFKAFDLFFVIGAKAGEPLDSTWIMSTYIFHIAYGDAELGYGCALAVIFTIVVLAVTLLLRLLTRGVARVEF